MLKVDKSLNPFRFLRLQSKPAGIKAPQQNPNWDDD